MTAAVDVNKTENQAWWLQQWLTLQADPQQAAMRVCISRNCQAGAHRRLPVGGALTSSCPVAPLIKILGSVSTGSAVH
jgi:hypothetical protein